MELSFEVKQQIDLFIKQCEKWLIDEPKPNKLKLEAKFGAVEDYLAETFAYSNYSIEFTTLDLVDRNNLFNEFKKDYPDFDNLSDRSILMLWYKLRDKNQINTISISYTKQNHNFNYENYESDDNYNVPECVGIRVHLDYREGIVYLETFDSCSE